MKGIQIGPGMKKKNSDKYVYNHQIKFLYV